MCLEQWYWVASIAGGLGTLGILIWTVISYRSSNKKTRRLIEAQKKVYEPNVAVRLIESETISSDGSIFRGILVRREDLLPDIQVEFMNKTQVYADLNLEFYAWVEEADGNIIDLTNKIIGDVYKGEKPFLLNWGEAFHGHFFIDMGYWLQIDPQEQNALNRAVAKIMASRLHIELSLNYSTDEKLTTPKFYDHYYTSFKQNVFTKNSAYVLIEGDWVLGSRNLESQRPSS